MTEPTPPAEPLPRTAQTAPSSPEEAGSHKTASGNAWSLVAMIVAIVAGLVVGLKYGDSMWRAGGGLDRKVEKLELSLAQHVARRDSLPEDAPPERRARLTEQIEQGEAKLAQTRTEAEQTTAAIRNGDYDVALFVWTTVKFAGELFLQVLTLLVVPLVVTSMVCGITSLGDIRKIGRLGAATISYYIVTTAIAVGAGIVLVILIQPGVRAGSPDAAPPAPTPAVAAEATGAEGAGTETSEAGPASTDHPELISVAPASVADKAEKTAMETLLDVVRGDETRPGSGMFPSNLFLAASTTNVLALIVFAIAFGGAVSTLGARGQVVVDFFVAANEAIMKMVHLVMLVAPLGIFGLVAYNIAKNGGGSGFYADMGALFYYAMTVIVGLGIHAIILMIMLAVLGKRNPFVYLLGVSKALLTAVTTASSSATLPVSFECVEKNLGVSNRTASFVLPLGATINMNGTALYEAVAAIYIAQSLGIELGVGQLLVIFLTASLAAIGAAGIPEAGLVTMVIVLTAVGLPIDGIGMILAIDWFLDRIRTTENVFGDLVGAGILDRFFGPKSSEAPAVSAA